MTKIAAIYARYSSDLQSDTSIDAQTRECRDFIARSGWQVGPIYADPAISGATLARPGIQKLMADAASRRFEIVTAVHTDRISRDTADLATFHKRMLFREIELITVNEGKIDRMRAGLGGLIGSSQLEELANKTRLGLKEKITDGLSAGGRAYGYRVDIKRNDPLAKRGRGHLVLDEKEAEIVRRIFTEYAEGKSPRAICAALNLDGYDPPRREARRKRQNGPRPVWSSSTINGNRARGTGILNNELYIGRRVWNRQNYRKNPDTGQRVSRPNEPDRLTIRDVPELRIVEQVLWDAVKARQTALDKVRKKSIASVAPGTIVMGKLRRPKHLLSGSLRCGVCGGGFSIVGGRHLGCSRRKEDKTLCSNDETVRYDDIEDLAMKLLRDDLMNPVTLARTERRINADLATEVAAYQKRRQRLLDRLHEVEASIGNIIDAIAAGLPTAALKPRLEADADLSEEIKVELDRMQSPKRVDLSRFALSESWEGVKEMMATEDGRRRIREFLDIYVKAIRVYPPSWNLATGEGSGHAEDWSVVIEGDVSQVTERFAQQDEAADASDASMAEERAGDPEACQTCDEVDPVAEEALEAERVKARAKHARALGSGSFCIDGCGERI